MTDKPPPLPSRLFFAREKTPTQPSILDNFRMLGARRAGGRCTLNGILELHHLLFLVLAISFSIGFISCTDDPSSSDFAQLQTFSQTAYCDTTGLVIFWLAWLFLLAMRYRCSKRTSTYRFLANLESNRSQQSTTRTQSPMDLALGALDNLEVRLGQIELPAEVNAQRIARGQPTIGKVKGVGMPALPTDSDSVASVAALSQAILESPLVVGIRVQCSHEESDTEWYTDAQGNRRTRPCTRSVRTFNHTYNFTPASCTVDETMFCGNDVMGVAQNDGHGSQYLVYDSDVQVNSGATLARFMETWRVHLHDANVHRDHTTNASLEITPAVPIVAEQMVAAIVGGEGNSVDVEESNVEAGHSDEPTWCFCCKFMSTTAYWMSVCCSVNWLYVYYFDKQQLVGSAERVQGGGKGKPVYVRCQLLYQKYVSLRNGMDCYAPVPAGGETLAMQVTLDNSTPGADVRVRVENPFLGPGFYKGPQHGARVPRAGAGRGW